MIDWAALVELMIVILGALVAVALLWWVVKGGADDELW